MIPRNFRHRARTRVAPPTHVVAGLVLVLLAALFSGPGLAPTPVDASGGLCPPGSYSETGSGTCDPAPAGTYVDQLGAMQATPCAPGSYQNEPGQTSCKAAPAGTYVDQLGATQATSCAPGSYQPNVGQINCLLAVPGYYVATAGAIMQTACAAGTTTIAVGATECQPINTSLVITSVSGPTEPVAINTTVTVIAAYSGAGIDHTSTFNWGDGSDDTAGTASGGTASGSHVYTAAGVYTVAVTVTDDDGDSVTESFQYVVVFDPSAGFVTGGGWIDSPAGAYTADETLTGKAHFGFVSRYKKGATTPDGNTQFQFQSGNFNFHSTLYDWLVISGPKAQYKGSGTVNGAGDYGFLLTANDGQISGGGGVDTFRLKVWNKADGAVVYDNQLDDADTADASNAIGGGSIVIHKAKK